MIRKILPICLAMIFLFTCANARAQHLMMEISVHHDDEVSSESIDLTSDGSRFEIYSTLFPGCFLSGTFPDTETFFSSGNHLFSFSFLHPSDLKPVLDNLTPELNPRSRNGFFSGDAFEEATSELYGTCSVQDILPLFFSMTGMMDSVISETETAGFLQILSAYGISSDSAAENLIYRIFDGGKYFSLTEKTKNAVTRTLSCNLSDPSLTKLVYGYAQSGKNYYWTLDFVQISPQELVLSAFFRTDPEKNGYRAIMNNEPVLQESWTFSITEDQSAILFSGSVEPQNDLDSILITGGIHPLSDILLFAELRFSGSPENQYFTLSIQKSDREITAGSLQEYAVTDLFLSGDHSFSGEILDGMTRIYSAMISYIPLDYTIRWMNLSD